MGSIAVPFILLLAYLTVPTPAKPTTEIAESIDDLVLDLSLKFNAIEPENFWHPYVYGTGNEHRESIHVQNVELEKFDGSYLQWKYARLGLKHYLVGIQPHLLAVNSLEFQSITSLDTNDTLVALEVFTQWNDTGSQTDLIILTATNKNRLYVYQLVNDNIHQVGVFPFEYPVKEIQVCHVGLSTKVILVPKNNMHFIDIYNIERSPESTHIWFFQRLPMTGPNLLAVYDSDMLDSIIAVARLKEVQICTFDAKAGMYTVLQTVSVGVECMKLFSFSIAYRHYVGCVPTDSDKNSVKFVVFDYDKNYYSLSTTLGNITAVDVFPVAAADYREEYFFIATGIDQQMQIYVDSGIGNGFQLAISCGNDKTAVCPDMTDVDLKKGVGFQLGEHTAYVFPAKRNISEETTPYLKIKTDVVDSESPVVEQSSLLYKTFYEIAEKFNNWDIGMREVDNALEKSVHLDKPNIISGDWNVKELRTPELRMEPEYVDSSSPTVDDIFGTFTFINEIWTEDDFNIPSSLLNKQLQTLQHDLATAEHLLNDALKVNLSETQVITGPVYASGDIKAEFFNVNFVSVATIQDYKAPKEYFDNFVLKSQYSKIHCSLVFEDIIVTNLVTSYLNELLVQDLAVKTQENLFKCRTTFNGTVNFNGDVEVSKVNGGILKDEVIFPNKISGCNFIDGLIVTNNTKTSGTYDFDNILLRSADQKVTAPYRFDTLTIVSNSNVSQIMGQDFSEFVDSIITTDYNGTITGKKEVQGKITADSLHIGKWNDVKFPDGFVSTKSNNIHLYGIRHFSKIEAGQVKVGNLLDEQHVESIVTEAFPMAITGKWTFEGEVTVDKDIQVAGLVDGVNLDDFMRKDSLDEKKDSYVINGDVEFESKVTFYNLQIKDRINDLDYLEAFGHLIMFKGSKCEIPGETTVLSNLTVESLTIEDDKINGIPLQSIMRTSGDQNLTGDITFTKQIVFNKLYALGHYNDIDLQEIALNGIYLNDIHRHEIHFAEIVCNKKLIVKGPVNGIEDYPSKVGVISGRKSQEFLGPLTFGKIFLSNLVVTSAINLPESGSIGGMNLEQWMRDRISLSQNETIPGKIKVNGQVKISKDLTLENLNGVEFSHLKEYSLREGLKEIKFSKFMKIRNLSVKNGSIQFTNGWLSDYDFNGIYRSAVPLNSEDTVVFEGNWHFQSIILEGPIRVKDEFCGVNLLTFQDNVVRQNDRDVEFTGQQNFHYIKVLESLDMQSLNGIPFESILMIDEFQSVECHMKFFGDVHIDGDLVTDGKINNVSLTELASYYSKNNNVHVVDGNLQLDYVDTLTLKVDGSLNKKHIDEYLSRLIKMDDSGLIFSGAKTFTGPVTINNQVKAHFYNSNDIQNTKILRLSDDVHLSVVHFNQLVVSESFHATGGVEAVLIDNVKWEDLVENSIPLIYNDTKPPIAYLWFDKIQVPSITNVKVIQGHRFDHLIPLDSDQTINKLRIKKMIFSGEDLHVTGLVLGHDLHEEYQDTLMNESNEPYELYGKKNFNGTITILQDVNCFGPEFKNDVVDITKEFYLASPVVFDQPVYVDGDVKVTEPVDGYTVESIMSEALTQEGDQVITGEWDFQQGITFQEDVNGDGDFEDFDIQELINSKNAEIAEVHERIGEAKQKYENLCYSVVNATQEFSHSPVKLDSFDSHQTILLEKQVERTITVSAYEKLFLFTSSSSCEIVKYELKLDPELFYQSVESNETRSNLGRVKEWHAGDLGDTGILVFYTVASDCSNLTTGVYVTYIQERGRLSQFASLHSGTAIAFTVITDKDNFRTVAIILDTDSHLKIISWDAHGQLRPTVTEYGVNGSYSSVQAVLLNDQTIGILLSSDQNFSIYHYHWSSKSLSLEAEQHYDSSGSIRSVFRSFGVLYAVLPSPGSQLLSLNGPCTLQVFKVLERSVSRYHQLTIQGLVSSTVFEFAHQPYVALLSKSHGLEIHKFMGLNGLQRMASNPIKVFNGLEVKSFEYRPWYFSVSRPFVTVLTVNTIEVYHSVTYGDSLDVNYNSLCRVH